MLVEDRNRYVDVGYGDDHFVGLLSGGRHLGGSLLGLVAGRSLSLGSGRRGVSGLLGQGLGTLAWSHLVRQLIKVAGLAGSVCGLWHRRVRNGLLC
jgi:hypothetical protein